MCIHNFYIRMADETEVYIQRWIPAKAPICVMLVSHGMGEHGGRYGRFAEWMNEAGIAVYAPDQRGHGRTAGSQDRLGHIADENGWELLVEDLHTLAQYIRNAHPGLPVFLLGHSMGSLLARRFIQRYGEDVHGVVLIATGGDPGVQGKLGLWIANREIKKRGLRMPSKLLRNLLFGGFNRHFRPRRTGLEWLNRDQHEVDLYLQDQWIATSYSSAFFRDLIGGTLALHRPNNLAATPEDLPILMLSGEKDPLGGFTKHVAQTYNQFKKIGCKNVTMKLYPEARHEILHELNREEVFADIADWILDRTNYLSFLWK